MRRRPKLQPRRAFDPDPDRAPAFGMLVPFSDITPTLAVSSGGLTVLFLVEFLVERLL